MRPLFFLLILNTTFAHADLRVFPTRVFITSKEKVGNISLRHIGNKPGTYRISTIFYRMKPDGGLDQISDPKPEERPALKLIRFSPRQVTLTPNVEQVVRILANPPKNLPEGDYRAHIHFEPSDEPEETQRNVSTEGKMSMRLQAKVAIAVPVIYRQGESHFQVSLSNLKVVSMPDKSKGFSLEMQTSGNGFPFGDFFLKYVPEKGEPQEVGLVRSVSSYLPHRTVSYPFNTDTPLKGKGILRAEFKQPEEFGGKEIAFVQTSVE